MWVLLLVSCAFLTVVQQTAGVYLCPPAFELYEGHCYSFHVNKRLNWVDARKECQDKSTNMTTVDLVSILSESENTFVNDTMWSTNYHNYWIGLKRSTGADSNGFYWVDGEDSTFRKWGPGEPNDSGGMENCVEAEWRTDIHGWNDKKCDYIGPGYVCKGKASDLTVEITPGDTEITRSVGSSLGLECSVHGLPTDVIPSVIWYTNSTEVSQSSRVFVHSTSPHSKKLYMFDIGDTDRGTYWCEASSGVAVVRSAVNLVVFKDITFFHAPKTQNPWFETDALIQCEASGDPVPIVWWRKQGEVIESGGRYVYEPAGLRIYGIMREDTGLYMCVAEVAAEGRVKETLITVIVKG